MNSIVSKSALAPRDRMHSNVSRRKREKEYTAAIVKDEQTAADAFRVRYASYLDYGFINPNSEMLFRDEFDELENATTIVVYEQDIAVGSVRVCFMSRAVRDAPAHHAFANEIDTILAHSARSETGFDVAEITRLVRSPDCADDQGLVFLLYRLAGYLGLMHDVQTIVSSVRGNHVPFYQRLGFRNVAGPMPYPGLNCPMNLLKCARADYDRVRAAFPLMDPDATPAEFFEGFVSGQVIAIPLISRNRTYD